jgi:hypothetical protein
VVPIALSPVTPGGAPVLPGVRNRNTIIPQFLNLFQKAQANGAQETPEIPEPKPLARKATGKQSADRQSARHDNQQAVLAPFVPGQQLKPISIRFPFSLDAGPQQAPARNDSIEATAGNTEPGRSSEAAPQQPNAPAVAFSINLEKFGMPDPKPGASGHQNTDSTQRAQPSSSVADISAQAGERSSSDSGSHQPGTEERDPDDPKVEPAAAIKQDFTPAAAHEIQDLPNSAYTAIDSTTGVEPPQAHRNVVADTQAIAPAEPPAMPVPVSPRHIELTVPNNDGYPVDIRVSQRGTDVQVTVRTLDGNLAQSMRHHLPELSENLSRNGPRDEFFHSAQSQPPETPAGKGDRQGQQDSQDRNRQPAKSRVMDQESGSFAEMIETEKVTTEKE